MVKTTLTHTGKIYTDIERGLEFLTVGDYGKENNIKADFLGYVNRIDGVKNTAVDLTKKWVATISTQKGCPMRCKFCDVPKFGFRGNASVDDLAYQIGTIIGGESVAKTERFNVHYARMGEPTFNDDVLFFTEAILDEMVRDCGLSAQTIHPVISTMCPSNNRRLARYLREWCEIKNRRGGEAGLQLSINSTDDGQREYQFSGLSLPLAKIASLVEGLPRPLGRKYTLNFAVTAETILSAKRLSAMFDRERFIVKITPIHQTASANENGFDVSDSYRKYDVYQKFEQPLLDAGWDVIVFVPSAEEDSDRITCGNALIARSL